jgi:hypothetical protein
MMAIEVNKDQARYDQPVAGGNVPIDTKHVKTEVVVENGGTIVIGGIYIQEVGNNTTKIPLLEIFRYSATCFVTMSARTIRPSCSFSSLPASSTISWDFAEHRFEWNFKCVTCLLLV